MPRSIIAANWKMNKIPSDSKIFIREIKNKISIDNQSDIIFFVPFTSLNILDLEPPYYLGAQNCHYKNNGAYTGEISLNMLNDCGVQFVIVGHSERREFFHESSNDIEKKISMILKYNMRPILCIGETLNQRKNGKSFNVVGNQIRKALKSIELLENIIIAYEPIWAIGSGETATTNQIYDMHQFIRNTLKELKLKGNYKSIPILYGGSVNENNARSLISIKGVNGFLIGGASIDVIKFSKIVDIVNSKHKRKQ